MQRVNTYGDEASPYGPGTPIHEPPEDHAPGDPHPEAPESKRPRNMDYDLTWVEQLQQDANAEAEMMMDVHMALQDPCVEEAFMISFDLYGISASKKTTCSQSISFHGEEGWKC